MGGWKSIAWFLWVLVVPKCRLVVENLALRQQITLTCHRYHSLTDGSQTFYSYNHGMRHFPATPVAFMLGTRTNT
jgi:hypothetical protein